MIRLYNRINKKLNLQVINNILNITNVQTEKNPRKYWKKLQERKRRLNVFFDVGDILNVTYLSKYIIYGFEGICLAIKKKKKQHLDCNILLRNRLETIGVEMYLAYYLKRLYNVVLADYKRKAFDYHQAKLYYLRDKKNKASTIKGF